MPKSNDTKLHLETYRTLNYALPTVVVAFLIGPVAIIQGIYAKYFGLSLTTIASVLLIARLFDAVTDPLIGYFSDHYYARTGSRKKIICTGAVLFIISAYFLYVPHGIGSSAPYDPISTACFLTWFLIFYLGWTMFEIPHLAWGSELAVGAREQNNIFSARIFGYSIGGLIFYAIPLLPIFEVHAFTPETLTWSVLIAAVFALPALYFGVAMVPERKARDVARATLGQVEKSNRSTGLPDLYHVLIANKPFLLMLSAFILSGTGIGMLMALLFIFSDGYLGFGENLPLIYLLTMLSSIISIGLWNKLSVFLGKRVCWGLGVIIIVVGVLGISLLTPTDGDWSMLLLLQTLIFSGSIAINIFVPSLLSDTIAYANWKFGFDHASTYFSIYTLVTKANLAVGGAVGLAVAGYYGFDPALSEHSDRQILSLHVAISYLPALMLLMSLLFVVLTPLNTRRNSIIRRRLDARYEQITS